MRNLELVDAVIVLHEIARKVEQTVGEGNLSADIRNCADRLHLLSIDDDRASKIAGEIIRQVKE